MTGRDVSFFDGRVRLLQGDCLEVMPTLGLVDAIVTDPPYHLTAGKNGGSGPASVNLNSPAGRARITAGFMGKAWDGGNVAFDPATWRLALNALKPGGYLVAFGAPRNAHRLTCAIEDAGFEIRDCLMWLFGSGFPKSLDVSKAIDKAAGVERGFVSRGPPVKRIIPGASQNKSGWEKTNGRQYQPGESVPATDEAARWQGWGTALKPACEPIILARKPLEGTNAENVLKHGVGALNIDGCRVTAGNGDYAHPGNELGKRDDEENWRIEKRQVPPSPLGRWPANIVHDGSEEVLAEFPETISGGGPAAGTPRSKVNTYGEPTVSLAETYGSNGGSAARFFYTAKADSEDRLGSKHPTVKPIDLMRWLCRLVTPPAGTILDPFAGTGTTGAAAFYEGFNAVLIERETEYVADIERRMKLVLAGPDERARAIAAEKHGAVDAGPLFA